MTVEKARIMEYASLVGQINGTLNIHRATVEHIGLEGAMFRLKEAEDTLNKIRAMMNKFYERKGEGL